MFSLDMDEHGKGTVAPLRIVLHTTSSIQLLHAWCRTVHEINCRHDISEVCSSLHRSDTNILYCVG